MKEKDKTKVQELPEQQSGRKEQKIELSRERVLEGIKEAVRQMQKMMFDAKVRYGADYNQNNEYEVFCRRFGADDAEKILHEFDLIRARLSDQPAVIRKVIKELGENAFRYCYAMWKKERDGESETLK